VEESLGTLSIPALGMEERHGELDESFVISPRFHRRFPPQFLPYLVGLEIVTSVKMLNALEEQLRRLHRAHLCQNAVCLSSAADWSF
jgi:hypothetical protein